MPTQESPKYAYALFHFGNSIHHIELELYFLLYLKKITTYDILYLYSSNDTTTDTINIITPLVTKAISYVDIVDPNTQFRQNKKYDNYSAFRTCNYIHAYSLTDYAKICVIEPDIIIMNENFNDIFNLNTPSILSITSTSKINSNHKISSSVDTNSGIILLSPNINKFKKCAAYLHREFFNTDTTTPRDLLFIKTESTSGFYNLPIKYNFSHSLLKHIHDYNINLNDIKAVRFDNTRYNHLRIVKDNWKNLTELREKTKPVMHFKTQVFDTYKTIVDSYVSNISTKYVALMFLTYNNIYFQNKYDKYFEQCNVYIHPKETDKIIPKNKQFIIDNIIETEWSKISIVQATVILLKTAFANKNNKYFILLSQDTCPLYSIEQLLIYLNLLNEKSVFTYVETLDNSVTNQSPNTMISKDDTTTDNITLYKTSQWWCLTREDVSIILKHYLIFNTLLFKPKFNSSKINAAPDEVFFLSLLKHYVPNYRYVNSKFIYTEWVNDTQHPTLFNKLSYTDVLNMSDSLFIRKTSPTFDTTTYFPSNRVIVLFVGTKTNQSRLLTTLKTKDFEGIDIIILSLIEYKYVHSELIQLCVKMYFLHWSTVKKNILIFTKMFKDFQIYSTVFFIEETYLLTSNILSNTLETKSHKLNVSISNFDTPNYLMHKIRDASVYIYNNPISITHIPTLEQNHRPLKYIHITKTGGSTIEESGEKYHLNWGKYDTDIQIATQHIDAEFSAFWHIPPQFFDTKMLNEIVEKYDLFAAVRNPYTRVISEYYYKFSGPKNKAKTVDEFNDWIYAKLMQVKRKLMDKNIVMNGHWTPQYLYILDKKNKIIIPNTRIIHMENMTNEFNTLMHNYGIPIDISKIHRQNESSSDKLFSDKDLTHKNIRLINEIYSSDFTYFGYDKINPSTKTISTNTTIRQINNLTHVSNTRKKHPIGKRCPNGYRRIKDTTWCKEHVSK